MVEDVDADEPEEEIPGEGSCLRDSCLLSGQRFETRDRSSAAAKR
jgi:hypothetical protein